MQPSRSWQSGKTKSRPHASRSNLVNLGLPKRCNDFVHSHSVSHNQAGKHPRRARPPHVGPSNQRSSPGPIQAISAQQRPPSKAQLRDPAHLHIRALHTVAVHDHGNGNAENAKSLQRYMNLPASQYSELDPELITSLSGNLFRLKVPRVTFFNIVWVQPTVDIEVRQRKAPPAVVLTSKAFRLDGSADWIRSLEKRCILEFQTTLTWSSDNKAAKNASIMGDLVLDVYTEVVPPFNLLSRSVLESTCNAVLKTLTNSLFPIFVRRLAEDYDKWALDEGYRIARTAKGLQ